MLKNDAFVKIKLEKELCKDDCEKQEKRGSKICFVI